MAHTKKSSIESKPKARVTWLFLLTDLAGKCSPSNSKLGKVELAGAAGAQTWKIPEKCLKYANFTIATKQRRLGAWVTLPSPGKVT